ncbi:MAG TPA: signal peptidase II [Minicystis sp.]|nr:signal peptidase II [Minicystis sp.]
MEAEDRPNPPAATTLEPTSAAADAVTAGVLPPDAAPHVVEAAPAEPPSPSIRFLAVLAGLSLAADLGTKIWAKAALSGPNRHMRLANRMHLIPDHLDLIFAQNPGGAWSFLRSLPDSLRRPFFLIVSASAIVFIITIYRRVRPEQWAMRWGLPLALGGALGNLADRIRFGWVVDFVDIYVVRNGQEHHWPTFNVADIAIVIGVALMAYEMMRPRRDRHLPAEPAGPPDPHADGPPGSKEAPVPGAEMP